nr:hypothetical protein [Terriglobales bacterium]
VRYGLELLPAFAVFAGVLVGTLLDFTRVLWLKVAVVAAAAALASVSYVAVWRAQPVSLREAIANSRTRIGFEHEVAAMMRNLPASANILMYMGQHAAILQNAGIPFRRTINEGSHRTWKQPADPEGLWEKALREPAKYVDYVVAFAGDPVWLGVDRGELTPLTEIHGGSGERVVIFKTRAAQ